MRMLCAVIILLVGCTTVPNSKVEPVVPPSITSGPPMPPMPMFMPHERQSRLEPRFALSETFTAPEPTPPYVSPVPTNAPSFGIIAPLKDGVAVEWVNWPVNTPYKIEVSLNLIDWKLFVSGMSSSNSNKITIIDRSLEDFPAFFYRLVP